MLIPKPPLHFLPSRPPLRKHQKVPLTQPFYCAQVKAVNYWRERQKRCRGESWGHLGSGLQQVCPVFLL